MSQELVARFFPVTILFYSHLIRVVVCRDYSAKSRETSRTNENNQLHHSQGRGRGIQLPTSQIEHSVSH